MDPEKVDDVLADTVRREQKRLDERLVEELDKIPLTNIIAYLRSKGYKIQPPEEKIANWL